MRFDASGPLEAARRVAETAALFYAGSYSPGCATLAPLVGSGVFLSFLFTNCARAAVNTVQKQLADQVRQFTEEVISGTSYFLVDVEVRGHKGTRVVEVYVDSTGELGHDDLAVISKEVGFLLDVEDIVDGSYKLEVSSPGIKRPLTLPKQYQKNVGRTLRVRHHANGKEEIVVGDLAAADGEKIKLEQASGEQLVLSYDDIAQARIELPW